jgi:CMP-N,N'-diacetyllegionaminic acid synthase
MSRIVALIPARAGSKGIKNKNIYPLNGKPLIEWTISKAKEIKQIDRVIVSTDGDEIANISNKLQAEVFFRDKNLSSDKSLVVETVRQVISELEEQNYIFDFLILLEPTSPLRNCTDIEGVILELLNGFDSAATFSNAKLNPHRAWSIVNGVPSTFIEGAIPWLPRQELPEAWELNGAVYGININSFKKYSGISLLFGNKKSILMPEERSMDIDNLQDLKIVEHFMTQEE